MIVDEDVYLLLVLYAGNETSAGGRAVDQRAHLLVKGLAHGIQRIQRVDRIHQVTQWILVAYSIPVASQNIIEWRSHGTADEVCPTAATASTTVASACSSGHHRATCNTFVNK